MSWLVEYLNREGRDNSREGRHFPTEFTWLESEYSADTWHIHDPKSPSSPVVVTINFDKRIDVRTSISNIPFAIEDMKRSLCIAIETSNLGLCQYSVSSASTARGFIDALKRIYMDIYVLTKGGSMRDIKSFHVKRLLAGLQETARYHYSVRKRVHDVLQDKLNSLPRHDRNRNRTCRTELYKLAGVDEWTARTDKVIVGWFDKIDMSLAMNEKFECPRLLIEEPSFVHPKQYESMLKAFSTYIQVHDLFPNYFENILLVSVITNPIDSYVKESKLTNHKPGNTKNIPPKTFLYFMDAAVRYVLDYADALFEIEEKAVDFYNSAVETYASRGAETPGYQAGKDTNVWVQQQIGPSGPHTPFPLQGYKQCQRRNGTSGGYLLSLRNALYGFLPASCLMIIYALSARRENEVLSLQAGCYREDSHGPSIKFYVEKTERDYCWFSTVPLVILAVKTLERLSKSARLETGKASLMIFKDPRRGGAIGTFNRLLCSTITQQFFDYINLPKDGDADWQKLSEHQFRRFFAIMYFYRYDGGSSVEALMRELGHADWAMTKTYLTELEAGKIFQQIEEDRIVDYGVQATIDPGVGGAMAEVFRSKFTSGLMVPHSPHREVVLEYIRENDYVIEFISEGVCFGFSKGRESRSNCFESGSVMCHRASSTTCKGCPNLLSIPDVKRNFFPVELKPQDCAESVILAAERERKFIWEKNGRS